MKQQVSKPEGVETGFWSLPHPPPKTASGFKTKHLAERSLLSKPTAPAPSWCVCGGDGRGKSSQSSPTRQQESRPRATVCSGEGAGQQGIYARGHRSNRNAGLPPSPLIPSHPLSSPPPTSPLLPSHLIPSDAILSLHLDHHPRGPVPPPYILSRCSAVARDGFSQAGPRLFPQDYSKMSRRIPGVYVCMYVRTYVRMGLTAVSFSWPYSLAH